MELCQTVMVVGTSAIAESVYNPVIYGGGEQKSWAAVHFPSVIFNCYVFGYKVERDEKIQTTQGNRRSN